MNILKPGRGRVLVRTDPKKDMVGRIHIPNEFVQEVYSGDVLAIGGSLVNYTTGQTETCPVEPGQHILFRKWEGVELPFPYPDDLVILKFSDLVAILPDGTHAEYKKYPDLDEEESPDAPAYDPAVDQVQKGTVEFEA